MALYDSIDPKKYDERFESIPREYYMKEHWEILVKSLISDYCRNKKVLELGCGTGIYSITINKFAEQFVGIDESQNMISYLKENTNISNVVCADAHKIPFKNSSFDVIVAIGLFEFVDKIVVINEIHRTLKNQGHFIFLSSNKFSAYLCVHKLISKIFRTNYIRKEPSELEMNRLFKENGFEIEKFVMDDGLIWLPDSLDRKIGIKIYKMVEKFFKLFKKNPFSNNMMFVVKKNQ